MLRSDNRHRDSYLRPTERYQCRPARRLSLVCLNWLALSLSETYALKYWWCSPPRTGIASVRPTVWMVRGIGASGPSGQPFRGFAVGTGTHTWFYVGETGDLSDRPLSHERKPCFDKNGANCLLIYSEKNRDMRLKIEADLRNAYNPPCNRSNAFSKKVENHACAVALHAMYY